MTPATADEYAAAKVAAALDGDERELMRLRLREMGVRSGGYVGTDDAETTAFPRIGGALR